MSIHNSFQIHDIGILLVHPCFLKIYPFLVYISIEENHLFKIEFLSIILGVVSIVYMLVGMVINREQCTVVKWMMMY